jgi:hypothetical protein
MLCFKPYKEKHASLPFIRFNKNIGLQIIYLLVEFLLEINFVTVFEILIHLFHCVKLTWFLLQFFLGTEIDNFPPEITKFFKGH